MSHARRIDSDEIKFPEGDLLIIDFQCDSVSADKIRKGRIPNNWIPVENLKISAFTGEIPGVLQLDLGISIREKQIKFY